MSDSQTPTQAIVASSQPKEATIEVGGRAIVIRVLSPIEQFRYKKVVGTFIANMGYMMDAMVAASVRSVNGEPMPFPQTEAGIEFILEKLGWDGWTAVQDHFNKLGADMAAAEIELAKN